MAKQPNRKSVPANVKTRRLPKPARKDKRSDGLPSAVLKEMENSLDRYIEKWVNGLLLCVDGSVRKLTKGEIRKVVQGSKRPVKRKQTG